MEIFERRPHLSISAKHRVPRLFEKLYFKSSMGGTPTPSGSITPGGHHLREPRPRSLLQLGYISDYLGSYFLDLAHLITVITHLLYPDLEPLSLKQILRYLWGATMTSTFLPENAGTTLTLKAESATCWGRGRFEARNGGESWNICGISNSGHVRSSNVCRSRLSRRSPKTLKDLGLDYRKLTRSPSTMQTR